MISRKYLLYILAISAAALYLYFFSEGGETAADSNCLFRRVTGIACPGCGTGRGIIFLIQGNFIKAWLMNPFSYLLLMAGLIIPVWILQDVARKKKSLEIFLQKPWSGKIQAVLFFLLGVNWIWNILKF